MPQAPAPPEVDVHKLVKELAQREAELTLINSVQQGLAMHADVQSIYDLVGERSARSSTPRS